MCISDPKFMLCCCPLALLYLLQVATISSYVGLIFKEIVNRNWFREGISKASLS